MHVTCCSVVATIAEVTLERLHVVMSLHVDLEMITAREGRLALAALEPLVASVQLDVTITAALVLEVPKAVFALEFGFVHFGIDGDREMD